MVLTARVVFVCKFVVSAGVSTALYQFCWFVEDLELSSSLTEDHTHTVYREEEPKCTSETT